MKPSEYGELHDLAVKRERLAEILAVLPSGHRWYERLAQALHEARVAHGKLYDETYGESQDEDIDE